MKKASATKSLLSSLSPAKGFRKKRKRIGRGQGSGHGKTATRGHKGAGSRSGHEHRAWFEGGQMPLVRRVPKRGFHSPFKKEFQVVNVETLQKLATGGGVLSDTITPDMLVKLGVVKKTGIPVKILGSGELMARLNVLAHAFSKSAVQKIETVGGKAQIISSTPKE